MSFIDHRGRVPKLVRPRWMVTFEAREDTIELDAVGVRELSEELGALAALCAYLQEKTEEAVRSAARASL